MSDSQKTELTFTVLDHMSLEEIKQKYNIAQQRAENFHLQLRQFWRKNGEMSNTPLPERLHFKYGAITKQIVEFWKEVVDMKENQTLVKPLTRKQERHQKKPREVPYDFGPDYDHQMSTPLGINPYLVTCVQQN
jgi:hypothetical protein